MVEQWYELQLKMRVRNFESCLGQAIGALTRKFSESLRGSDGWSRVPTRDRTQAADSES